MNGNNIKIPLPVIVTFVALFLILFVAVVFMLGRESARSYNVDHSALAVSPGSNVSVSSEQAVQTSSAVSSSEANVSGDLARNIQSNSAVSSDPNVTFNSYASDSQPKTFAASAPADSQRQNAVPVSPASAQARQISADNTLNENSQSLPSLAQTESQSFSDSYSNDRERVRQYVYDMEMVLSSGKSWTDPNDFAGKIVQSIMKQDYSDFDMLVENMEKLKARASAVQAFGDCIEHKQAVVHSFDMSLDILKKVRSAVSQGDVSTLTTLNEDSDRIKAASRKADDLMKAIKEKYDL